MPEQPSRSASWPSSFLGGAIAGTLAAVGVFVGVKYFDANAHAVPRIAVLDIGQVVAALPKDDSAPDAVKERMNRVRETIEKLKDSGFVVLDGQVVLGAPEESYVPIDMVR